MQNNKQTLISVLVLIVLAGVATWFIDQQGAIKQNPIMLASNQQGNNSSTTTPGVTTALIDESTVTLNGEKVVVVRSNSNIPIPDLNRISVVTNSSLSASIQATLASSIKAESDSLKKDPNQFYVWLNLGINRKILGDYEGARQAWEYVSLISPRNSVSYGNLGDLYQFYLKDYAKAEINLQMVVKNDPTYVRGYMALYDLYHLSYQTNTNKAEQTLLAGIKAVPDSTDLIVALASYYKEKGLNSQAKTYYQQALALAQKLNNTTLQTQIQNDMSGL
jgi:tetratricopeptide (TPR) repeat protein